MTVDLGVFCRKENFTLFSHCFSKRPTLALPRRISVHLGETVTTTTEQRPSLAADNGFPVCCTAIARNMSAHPETSPPGAVEARGLGAGHESDDGDGLLAAMGYKAELVRTRSTWQVAFMSFVLASIPYGLATTLYYPLQGGGPVVVVWGWLAVSLIVLCVAASLGEITSVYPTAGGVYYQTFMLAPARFRRVAAYICGWAYVVGNITITLAVQFGTTLFFVACVNVFETEPGVGVWAAEPYQVFLTFLAVTLLCNAISTFGNRWLPLLDVSCPLPSFAS